MNSDGGGIGRRLAMSKSNITLIVRKCEISRIAGSSPVHHS